MDSFSDDSAGYSYQTEKEEEPETVTISARDYSALQKSVQEKDAMIGRTSNELGALRKMVEGLVEKQTQDDYVPGVAGNYKDVESTNWDDLFGTPVDNKAQGQDQVVSPHDVDKIVAHRLSQVEAARKKEMDNHMAIRNKITQITERHVRDYPELANSKPHNDLLLRRFGDRVRAEVAKTPEDYERIYNVVMEETMKDIKEGLIASPKQQRSQWNNNPPSNQGGRPDRSVKSVKDEKFAIFSSDPNYAKVKRESTQKYVEEQERLRKQRMNLRSIAPKS